MHLTRKSITSLLKSCLPFKYRRMVSTLNFESLDATQKQLLAEKCILLDVNDKIIGAETKKNCHLKSNIKQHGMLHRAFSVFLFSQDGTKMFLQQRSPSKITYPSLWSNACCSHPLFDIEAERNGWPGVKKAALRRLKYELGPCSRSLKDDDLVPMGRVHYEANNSVQTEPEFMEHEIDYLLFVRSDIEFEHVNDNEVMSTTWVTQMELSDWMTSSEKQFTPWFKLIMNEKLFKMWSQVTLDSNAAAFDGSNRETEPILRLNLNR